MLSLHSVHRKFSGFATSPIQTLYCFFVISSFPRRRLFRWLGGSLVLIGISIPIHFTNVWLTGGGLNSEWILLLYLFLYDSSKLLNNQSFCTASVNLLPSNFNDLHIRFIPCSHNFGLYYARIVSDYFLTLAYKTLFQWFALEGSISSSLPSLTLVCSNWGREE